MCVFDRTRNESDKLISCYFKHTFKIFMFMYYEKLIGEISILINKEVFVTTCFFFFFFFLQVEIIKVMHAKQNLLSVIGDMIILKDSAGSQLGARTRLLKWK